MLQFYFLSIVANFLAGLTLSSDWFARKFSGLAAAVSLFSGRMGKMVLGLASLLVGFGTLFVPAEAPLILGDLFPSVMGMAMGIALLFEVFKQDAVFPAERGEKVERVEKLPLGYRTTLGVLGIAAAILHFFLPERPFL
jgi:cadmium resistance protein CadD (predicted permease)